MVNSKKEIVKLKKNALNKIYNILETEDFTVDQLAQIVWSISNIKNDISKITCKEEDE